MVAITASPKGFSKLLELQEVSNENLIKIKELLEDQHASNLALIIEAKKNEVDNNKKMQLEEKAIAIEREMLKLQNRHMEKVKENQKIAKKHHEEHKKELGKLMESMKTFKSPLEKFSGGIKNLVEKFSPENMKKSFLEKTNIFGINNKRIQKQEWMKEQRALGATGSEEELAGKFEKAYETKKEYAKVQEEIEKLKKETGGKYTEKELEKSSDTNKALFARKNALMQEYAKQDIGAQLKAYKDKETADPLHKTPTSQFAAAAQSEEEQIENARLMGEQTDLLKKIEENTRGAGGDKATPVQDDSGGGGGLLSGLLGGGKSGGILKGLKDFGIGLVLIAGSLWVAAKAFKSFAEVEWESVGKGMVVLAGMVASAVLLSKASKSLKEVGIGMAILGGSLWVAAKGFAAFAEVNWSELGKGIVALGSLVVAALLLDKVKGQIIAGAVGLGVLAASVWAIGKSLSTFQELEWETIGKGMVALGGIGVIGAIAGTAAPLIAAGAVALGLMGGALWVIGEAMQAVGDGFDKMGNGLERLGKIDGQNLLSVAAGVAALGPAMALFAAGNVAAGISNLVTGFLSAVTGQKSPVDQLIDIAAQGKGINEAGSGMQRLADGMSKFNELNGDNLKKLKDFPWEQATKFVAAGGAINNAGKLVYNASKINADESAAPKTDQPNVKQNIVNAPVTNNTNQNNIIKSPIRNQESSQSAYIRNRYAM
jgi:hypothetical protein